MEHSSRKTFIRNLAFFSIGTVLSPRELLANTPVRQLTTGGAPAITVNELSIVDLHCHPALKMDLWGRKFWNRHHPGTGMNATRQQVDNDNCELGHVKGMMITHYLVEASAEREWDRLKLLFGLVHWLFRSFLGKFENEDESNYDQILRLMQLFENQISITNAKLGSETYVIARNYEEFENAIKRGQIPCAHAIEGGHSLGRDQPVSQKRMAQNSTKTHKMISSKTNEDLHITNLIALKEKGICMMSLAHLFPNDLADCVEGISADGKKFLKMSWTYDNNDLVRYNTQLKPIGKRVAEKMLEIGMIIDLTHSTPATRKQVFEMNRDRQKEHKEVRPVIFSHAGSQEVFEKYENKYDVHTYDSFKYYNVSEEDIRSVSECGGVIGIIPETFWLTGADTHLHEFPRRDFKHSIPFMVETMIAINRHTINRNYENIAIGTDFDGFADASIDFFKAKHIPDLIAEMRKYPTEFPDPVIKKIFQENAMRILKNGWTKPDEQ